MTLTLHDAPHGPRWALDGTYLRRSANLGLILHVPRKTLPEFLHSLTTDEAPQGRLVAPIDPDQEVWAAGVTYLRSRDARQEESDVRDVYSKVYDDERPELFYKSAGWRVAGPEDPIRVRTDSTWNVPEPELTLVINSGGEVVGFTAGNDVSSRDIEGQNPLYLPQAKVYNGSCAIGPSIELAEPSDMSDLPIQLDILRDGTRTFTGDTRTGQMKRSLEELVRYLFIELEFPRGAFLMTGTGIVPPSDFSLRVGDAVTVTVGGMQLRNQVA